MLEMLLALVGQSALFGKLVILENLMSPLLVYILYSYIIPWDLHNRWINSLVNVNNLHIHILHRVINVLINLLSSPLVLKVIIGGIVFLALFVLSFSEIWFILFIGLRISGSGLVPPSHHHDFWYIFFFQWYFEMLMLSNRYKNKDYFIGNVRTNAVLSL